MKKLILVVLILLASMVWMIKTYPEVRDIAREQLPEPILKLIGEKPKNFLERLID